ncbi:MAG TPA: TonB-dependent receptor [Ramlibacter sp.]|nr:TonB-dependent receptor [Ramlibacter sp.]
MNPTRVPQRSFALSLALAAAFPSAFSQTSLSGVVVTATRNPARADELVSDIKVIDRQAIEASTARSLPELLARVAGVQMSANGGIGKQSAVFVRGGENRHTILLVDGVRIASATAGTPTWESIPVEMIERIEVLKGPASALYGSDGVAGVVQVFLRKGREGFHPYASLAVGSGHYARAGAGLQGGQGNLGYSIGVERLRVRGLSATNPRVPFGQFNPDVDPFEQDAVTASARYQVNKDWRVDGGFMYSSGVSSFDDGLGFDARAAVRAATAHIAVKGRLSGAWETQLRVSQGNDTNNSFGSSFPGSFKTEQTEWSWQNDVATSIGKIVAGLEQRVQRVGGSTAYTVTDRTINAVFAGVNGGSGSHSWQLNARHDANSQFGSANTWFAGYGFRFSPSWRVHASHGTSFVAPSFNQLYFPFFGNPALREERGRNTDVGVTWAANGHEVKLVRFDNRIRGFMTNTTLPINIPRARIEGWTLGYEGKAGNVALRAALDALDPRNELNGRQLPRRAKSQVTAGADYVLGAWKFGGSIIHTGDRFDDAANALPLPAYTTADAYADWQFARDWSVQAKLNNLTDKQYETAYGYNQPGRSFFLTLRWQPK